MTQLSPFTNELYGFLAKCAECLAKKAAEMLGDCIRARLTLRNSRPTVPVYGADGKVAVMVIAPTPKLVRAGQRTRWRYCARFISGMIERVLPHRWRRPSDTMV